MIDENTLAALEANYTHPAQALVAKKKDQGNFLTHLLPSIGGTGGGVAGGAAGGALAGTAILPGVGTALGGLAGALLGGFGGGAAGKVVENKLEGKAAGDNVLGQGIEQGVLSAGPLKLLKGATLGTKAAMTAAKDGEGLAGAINAIGESATSPSLLTKGRALLANKGAQAEARAGGFGIGEKVSGSQPLGFYDSAAITQNLKNEGIKPGSPEFRLKQVEDALNSKGSQIDQLISKSNKSLSDDQKLNIAQEFTTALEKQPGLSDTVRESANNLARNFLNQAHDAKSIIDFRRGLDNQVIAFNRNPDAKQAADQLAARTFRTVLTDNTNKLIPGVSTVNKSYSNLMDAKGYLLGGSKAISDQSQGGGGVISRMLTNDTAQAVKSRSGRALQSVAPSSAAPAPFGLGSVASRTLPVGVIQAGNAAGQSQQPDAVSQPQDLTSALLQAQGGGSVAEAQGGSPYTQENLLSDINRDPKNAQKYMDYYDSLDKIFKTSKDSGVTKPSAQQYGLAQSGVGSLQQLATLIQKDPSIIEKNATPGQGLPVVGSLVSKTAGASDYHSLADNILSSLIHLQTGATATPEEIKSAHGQLPQPGDPPDVQQRKLQTLLGNFAPFVGAK